MRLAASSPGRVERLVLLSPVGIARFKIYVRSGIPVVLNFGRDMTAAGERLIRMAFTPPESGLTFNREIARAFLPVLKHYRVGVLAGVGSGTPTSRELVAGVRSLAKFVRAEPAAELRKMHAPALLLVGEYESVYDPHQAVRRAAQHMPHVIAEIVPQSGHATIYDQPDVVNPRILRFLRNAT